jgi:phosphotransferase system enzyme I (PtsP)
MPHLKLLCDFAELHWVFSDSHSLRSFLRNVVTMVGRHMNAQVASVYLYDEKSRTLTLRASVGLSAEAVDQVSLKLGEGLAGLALKELRPICESQASSHPNFRAFKGILEEQFDEFLAVPVHRGVQRVGVLVAQRTGGHGFSEEEVMAMQAVGSQLANIIENARLLLEHGSSLEQLSDTPPLEPGTVIEGRAASQGWAMGPVHIHRNRGSIRSMLAREDYPKVPPQALRQAVDATEKQLSDLQRRVEERLSDAASLIFSAHLLMLRDEEFTGAAVRLTESGLHPARALVTVANQFTEIFRNSEQPYIQEKANDVEDLTLRLLDNLLPEEHIGTGCGQNVIVARELFPSELLALASEDALGVVLVSGGITSHLSILARSLRIPLVIVDDQRLLSLPRNTELLVDAENGTVHVQPDEANRLLFLAADDRRRQADRTPPQLEPKTVSPDGVRLRLAANVNLLSDVELARQIGAEGVGLYRSEFPFMVRTTFPTEEEQFILYERLLAGMPDQRVAFRTLDVGGDKVLPYFPGTREQNPFLGMRSIRFSLAHTDLFRQQLRAILRAGAGRKVEIMFPMVSSLEELLSARELVRDCIRELDTRGVACTVAPRIGIMVEIPSVAELIPDLAPHVDFFSIGTNDLIQYLLAVDRTNEKVAHLYIPHHPAVIRVLWRVVSAATEAGLPVCVCGDMAGMPLYLPFLVGIGVREFSVDPGYLYRTQAVLSRIDTVKAADLAARLRKEQTASAILDGLQAFAAASELEP